MKETITYSKQQNTLSQRSINFIELSENCLCPNPKSTSQNERPLPAYIWKNNAVHVEDEKSIFLTSYFCNLCFLTKEGIFQYNRKAIELQPKYCDKY